MEITNKIITQIQETKYLSAENAWRYRSILRFFYLQYEKIKYWMYKEEILEELKHHDIFKEYTMDQCKQDLDTLVEWGNLTAIQDTSKVATVEEFKNKQFRYQLSEYSVEIERMTIKLENMFVEGASLEPTLLERLKVELKKFPIMVEEDTTSVGIWWNDLNTDFKRLNQNYQDYIRSLQTLKAEEMMKTKEFLVFKDRFIEYLRNFIKGLQQNVYAIEDILKSLDKVHIDTVLNKVLEYEKSIPRMDSVEIADEEIYENIEGRWTSLLEWFLGRGNLESEAAKLFDTTNEIIRKITRYGAQIAESRSSAANRKEEYKKVCDIFLNCKNIDEAHKLSSLVFGVAHTKHIKGNFIRQTESINSGVFDEDSFEVKIKPRIRNYREKMEKSPIKTFENEKKAVLNKILQIRREEKEIMNGYIKEGHLDFRELPIIEGHIRNTILRWLSKAMGTSTFKAKTEDGRSYEITNPHTKERCRVECTDGTFEMPAYKIKFMDL